MAEMFEPEDGVGEMRPTRPGEFPIEPGMKRLVAGAAFGHVRSAVLESIDPRDEEYVRSFEHLVMLNIQDAAESRQGPGVGDVWVLVPPAARSLIDGLREMLGQIGEPYA